MRIVIALVIASVACVSRADVTVALVDTTVIPGNSSAPVDVVILGGDAFAGGSFSFQIKKTGVDPATPDLPADDATDIKIREIRFGTRTVWRHNQGAMPQFISPTVTDPLPAARTVANFGNNPFPGTVPGDPDRPPGEGLRPAQGLLCTLILDVAADAEPGIRYITVNYQGFSTVWGVSQGDNAKPVILPTQWVGGKVIVFSLHGLLTPTELRQLAQLRNLLHAAESR
jgi:hypothetical protein